MEFQGITSGFTEGNVEALAVAAYKGEKASEFKDLDLVASGQIAAAMKAGEFKGDAGEFLLIRLTPKGKLKASKLLLVGAGDRSDQRESAISVASGAATRYLRKCNVKSFAFDARSNSDAVTVAQNAVQGAITSQFELDKYKTKDKNDKAVNKVVVYVAGAKSADLNKGIERGRIIGDSMNFTRDLANEPPNILHPTEMAKRAQVMAKETGLKCEILDEAKMKRLGMGSLLSVSLGSEQPAKLIVLRYTPTKSTAKKGDLLAFVGKGITFDTGGISLKPGDGMDAMKYDMSGGATVLGTMRAIALLKPSIPVLGIVAAVENMPDGRATRPSDIVTAMNGKTIEILNTDAEGRLILADAVAYAEKQGANRIVDMATLTGAVIIALGEHNTGIMGNDQGLIDEIISCGKEAGEGFWQLPVGGEYSKQIRSDIADIKNIGPRGKAGTIMGAVFIQEFVDKAKWAHLDIAGTAWADGVKPHQAKGPTGVAIRSLIKLVERSQ
ncbi:leucyl aminopeptidase [Leptolyngbya sp. 7M]|uniref:leucyl aminopeptidase n=1 Tax=Leptolyngbya sp. 7M TaxID=2812896 RepID=UPI001B8D1D79|nr:leucyl aminopeptidase [Leptolyngbya sp. 7M]QYO65343.1 leucyl aminopeptidase [Leptolyngbya sp. 7M]